MTSPDRTAEFMDKAQQVFADADFVETVPQAVAIIARALSEVADQYERKGMERAAEYHEDLAAQHEAALSDNDVEGNAWHLAQSVGHRRHARAILSEAGEGA